MLHLACRAGGTPEVGRELIQRGASLRTADDVRTLCIRYVAREPSR